MKKKALLVGAGVVVMVVLVWKVEWISTRIYQELGRRKIYPQDSIETRYPGEGENKQWRADRLWVVPKGVGKPKYAEIAKRGEYPPTDYDVVEVPAREEWFFTVGKVARWERIAGSADLYLHLTYRGTKERLKYRVVMDSSVDTKREGSVLAVEDVGGTALGGGLVEVAKVENVGTASEVGSSAITKIIRRGDSVIILPEWEPPEMAKRDEQGQYLAAWLVVRRVGGKEALLLDLQKQKGGQ